MNRESESFDKHFLKHFNKDKDIDKVFRMFLNSKEKLKNLKSAKILCVNFRGSKKFFKKYDCNRRN